MLSRRLIRIKIVQSIYSHLLNQRTQLDVSLKELLHSTQKCYDLYIQILNIVDAIHSFAQERIDKGLAKHRPSPEELNPNLKFVTNPVILILKQAPELQNIKATFPWTEHRHAIKEIYEKIVSSLYYTEYMCQDNSSFDDHKQLIINILIDQIDNNETLETIFEDNSIFWSDNIEYAINFVIKTIKTIKSDDTDLSLFIPFKNYDDQLFATSLFEKTIINKPQNLLLIQSIIENWEIERLSQIDKILLLVALAELTEFETIPTKVTLDEFIEISKYYSSPQSSIFINGVLDKAVQILHKQGKIVKLGRGLI